MKSREILLLLGAAAAHADPVSKRYNPDYTGELAIRALPNSPSGGYAPEIVDCPSRRPRIRLADGLSDAESAWVEKRRNNTIDPMREFLIKANISGFNAGSYIDRAQDNATALPNIAIAVSGGGYRALMNGAGFLSAADSRNGDNYTIGGLLQSATYLAGLSGGGWLVGSMFANNFTTIPDLQAGSPDSPVWRFDRSIFVGPQESGIGILNTADYWSTIVDEVGDKADGWETSITDYWGRALSFQLVNASDGGPAYTFSSIADTGNFQDGQTPFPILVSDGRAPGQKIISTNATVYEFNPFELGTWDPTVYEFAPLQFLASNFSNGSVSSNGDCVRGFDQIGFVMGTSSSLFNSIFLANLTASDSDVPSVIRNALVDVLNRWNAENNDVAQYAPNPFRGWNPNNDDDGVDDQSELYLVDGGEDLQNIPLHPLIQPYRGVDIIFAVDSSADTTTNWPNGTAMRASYDRSGTGIGNSTLFPPVPSAETFINLRLNQRPTLFGCDANNFTLTGNQMVPPLIFYIPNAPYTTHSNVSTFDPSYSIAERNAIIENGFNGATQGNDTVDSEWSMCVACAILSRSWWKAGEDPPEACNNCFDRYCWNGTTDDSSVGKYEPNYIIGETFDVEGEQNLGNTPEIGLSTVLALSLCVMIYLGL
ncbi:lysophospholipase catalytic domain-containing protein [Stachybotrys elegans]|uniref:Lysophospholipase n=1 Tax=Stachybotrys elegans TaxID=80388 RepID=A0A8K0WSF0_9HYPO|nr:lysophospholipase catalytic domain-containing protein [Stachybotrys elegans]